MLQLLLVSALAAPQNPRMDLPFETFTLDNGLEVVVHEDHSDPVVAVYVVYHVGSGRERPGRSGFAHLFEHMLFQGSQHVDDDGHFKLVSEAGGTLNGTTNFDRTLYYEVLPANQLELALWLEADRMGFLLPALTQESFDNQVDVVKNERRQNYENRPYRRGHETILAAMFPSDHPYSWPTIGSMADLSAATLDDVHAFFRRWYGPNNATLAVGGDVDSAQVRAWVERYFGSIPAGPEVARPEPRPVRLEADRRVVLEDRVQLPQLVVSWPTVTHYTDEDAALTLLEAVLSANKSAVLDRALQVEEELVRDVSASNSTRELAGEFRITLTAAPGVSLDALEQRLGELLLELAERGIDPDHLERMKTRFESRYVRAFETVSGRTSALAEASVFEGDPAAAARWLERVLAVSAEDVHGALKRHLVGRPAVILSVVPEGRVDLAASGRTPAQVEAEAALDRTQRPAAGPVPEFHTPPIWHDRLPNGVAVLGTPFDEIPMTRIELSLPGGRLAETEETAGLSTLVAAMLGEGTERLSTTEWTEALDDLGATLAVSSDREELTFSLATLDRNLVPAVELLGELLLTPRFDPEDFERLRRRRLAAIDTRGDDVRGVAETVFARLVHGDGSPLGAPARGTRATIESLTLDTARAWYRGVADPSRARLVVVGDHDAAAVQQLFAGLAARWTPPENPIVAAAPRPAPARERTALYLVDRPGAAQSELRVGHMGPARTNPDYYALDVLNYVLGGSFSSRVNMNLREDKGYTYGARTSLSGSNVPGPFQAGSGVHTHVTADAVRELLGELQGILAGPTQDELDFARAALLQANARRYESMRALAGLVDNVGRYGFPDDYPERNAAELRDLTTERLRELAVQYLEPDRLVVLVVGDAEQVRAGLDELGLGPVVELDVDGAAVDGGAVDASHAR